MSSPMPQELSKYQAYLDEQATYTWSLPEDSEIHQAISRFLAEEEAKKLDAKTKPVEAAVNSARRL